jgi:hypothetical protein
MLRPPHITQIWRCLDLPHCWLSEQVVDAMRVARNPRKSLLDCPWNEFNDTHSRKLRVTWRIAFRAAREKGEVPFITVSV